jgi:1-deoxy-D-xylulose-5-phosphate synthase
MAPSSAQELHQMLHDALDECDGPVAIRYPKGQARQVAEDEVGRGLRARRMRQGGGAVCVLALGKLVGAAEQATATLVGEGYDVTLWDIRVAKPLDPEMIADAARHQLVVTVEDGVREGGTGALILDALDRACADTDRVPPCVEVLGVPVEFLAHGKPDDILARLGLDADGIAAAVRAALPAARVAR